MPEPSSAPAESASREPAAYRLVIRAQIVSDPVPDAPERRSNVRVFALVATAIVLPILGWTGFSAFRTDSKSGKSELAEPRATQPQAPAAVVPYPPPAAEPDTPLRPVDRATPTASPGALNTIRGTIRVAIEVTIDAQGRVIDAVAAEPGPSRYFERVSLEASRRWTFTPARADTPRRLLLRFHFTRAGATASVADEAR